MQCRAYAAQLGRYYEEFREANTELLVILGSSLDRARSYAQQLKLVNPVLADPGRKVYQAYGLEKAFVFIQRTATVIVDFHGIVRYIKRATNPMVWLSEAEETRNAVRELAASQRDH
jgi:peroxiredoxin